MAFEPGPVLFGLVRTEVVEDDVQLPAGMRFYNLVHEGEKLYPTPSLRVHGRDVAGGDVEGSEERGRAVAFVFMVLSARTALPLGSFRYPWARSKAWICGFSSTQSTTAFSGGAR